MVKIEAVVQPSRLDAIKTALDELGVTGITISHVMDHSGSQGLKARYRGADYHVDTPRVKLEMVVSSLRADDVLEVLSQAARTGTAGDDGTICICEVTDAMRIRNGSRVQVASL